MRKVGEPDWTRASHQQPEVTYLPRFSPQLISLERYTLSVYRAGEIDLFKNLDIVHIRLLVDGAGSLSVFHERVGECVSTLRIDGVSE